ncbi:MAG TPA: hypothetical protein VHO47_03045 [Candidatus Babeliales bacterium]|nr:hypothetical protein [Candidatus Babeliales bacterium]
MYRIFKNRQIFSLLFLATASCGSAQANNGALAKSLERLQLKIDEFAIVIAPKGQGTGFNFGEKFPNLSVEQIKLLEKILGSQAIVKTLTALTEQEILKIIEDLLRTPEYAAPGQEDVPPPPTQEGEDDIPLPPGQDDDGDIPPPPGEGMPSGEPEKKELGLTIDQIAKLSADEKEASDEQLLAVLKKLAQVYRGSFQSYLDAIKNVFSSLGSKKDSAFKFMQGNDPKRLGESIVSLIEKLMPQDKSPEQRFKNASIVAQNKNREQEFLELLKPWILGSAEQFDASAKNLIPQLLINSAAAMRKDLPQIKILEIDQDSRIAAVSDKQFLEAVSRAQTYEELLNELNLLRLNQNYLKAETLEEDLYRSQHKAGVKESVREEAIDLRQALEREIREKGKSREGGAVGYGSAPLLQLLKDAKTVQEVMQKVDLGRYLFYIARFNNTYQASLDKFLQGAKQQDKDKKNKDIPEISFAEYLSRAINKATTLSAIFDVLRLVLKAPQLGEDAILLQMQEGTKKLSYYVKYDAQMKTFQENKLIQRLANIKDRFTANQQESFAQELKRFNLSAEDGKKVDALRAQSQATFDLSGAIDQYLRAIQNPVELTPTEKRKAVVALYQKLSTLANDKQYAAQKELLESMKDVLINPLRTRKEVQEKLLPLIIHASPENRNRVLGSLAIIEPYGFLAQLFNIFSDKVENAKTVEEKAKIRSDLLEILTELNERGIVSEPDLAKLIGSESYKEKLSEALELFKAGRLHNLLSYFDENFFSAGKSIAQEVNRQDMVEQFNKLEEKMYRLFAHTFYAAIVSHLQAIKNKKEEIIGLERKSNLELYPTIYEQFTRYSGELLNKLKQLNFTDFSEQDNKSVQDDFDDFAIQWTTATTKALEDEKISKDDIKTIEDRINLYAQDIRRRFSQLVKK